MNEIQGLRLNERSFAELAARHQQGQHGSIKYWRQGVWVGRDIIGRDGICLAAAVKWLRDRRYGVDFFADSPENGAPFSPGRDELKETWLQYNTYAREMAFRYRKPPTRLVNAGNNAGWVDDDFNTSYFARFGMRFAGVAGWTEGSAAWTNEKLASWKDTFAAKLNLADNLQNALRKLTTFLVATPSYCFISLIWRGGLHAVAADTHAHLFFDPIVGQAGLGGAVGLSSMVGSWIERVYPQSIALAFRRFN